MIGDGAQENRLELDLGGGSVLTAERLRDGRIAMRTNEPEGVGTSTGGELTILGPREALELTGWLATAVEEGWLRTVRDRAAEIHRTARELYGDEHDAERRLADVMVSELPPALLRRAFVLLVNSIGPASRERLVTRLNETDDFSEEAILRRRLAEEQEAFGYAIAAAALFDLIHRRDEEPDAAEGPTSS
jgi:hypothetical protein